MKDYVKRYACEEQVDVQYKALTKKKENEEEEAKVTSGRTGVNRRKLKEVSKKAKKGATDSDDDESDGLSETSQLDIIEDEGGTPEDDDDKE